MTVPPPDDCRRVLVAANPCSGRRSNCGPVERLLDALRGEGLAPVAVWDSAERARLLRRETWRAVVVAAGDGTVNDVINEGVSAPLAALPLGTENLFARRFGCGHDVRRLARALAHLVVRPLDAGEVIRPGERRRFVLMLSAGVDAEIVRRLAEARGSGRATGRGGYVAYLRPTLGAAAAYRWPRLRVEADDVTAEGTHLLVFNVDAYALGLSYAPDARDDDGRLDWVLFPKGGLPASLGELWSVWRGRHLARPGVRHGRARSLRIEAECPAPLQADGDAAGFTSVEIQTHPAALKVVVVP